MNVGDKLRTIAKVKAQAPATLILQWSDGTGATLDVAKVLKLKHYRSLRDPRIFVRERIGEWGHSVEWPSGADLSAEMLWLETLSATGRGGHT